MKVDDILRIKKDSDFEGIELPNIKNVSGTYFGFFDTGSLHIRGNVGETILEFEDVKALKDFLYENI